VTSSLAMFEAAIRV